MKKFEYKSIAELRSLIQSRETSAQEVTESYLERVERINPKVNCFLSVDVEEAMDQAKKADDELQQGLIRSQLHGIPIALKDIFECEGRSVTAGSKPFSFTSRNTATVICRLRSAGAVLLGRLNLDEFAAGGTGDNAHFGRCRNPWNRRYITGGSSSGSAAAIAARLAIAALGSDAGGSIRIPAAYCGVTGMKPTYGRISRFGAIPRTWSMDCIGPIAHSAEDCATVLDVISGTDDRDITSLKSPTNFQESLAKPFSGIRIGIDQNLIAQAHDEIQHVCQDTIHLVKELGSTLHSIQISNIDLLNDLQQVIVKSEAAALHGKRIRHHPEDLSMEMKSVIQEGFALPATTYIEALSLRARLLNELNDTVFAHCDSLLLPVTPSVVPQYIEVSSTRMKSIEKDFSESARFTRFANYLGLPAISFPCGFDQKSLPVGMQLIGQHWSEQKLLETVHAVQQVTDYHLATPTECV